MQIAKGARTFLSTRGLENPLSYLRRSSLEESKAPDPLNRNRVEDGERTIENGAFGPVNFYLRSSIRYPRRNFFERLDPKRTDS